MLEAGGIPFSLSEHEPVFTSADAAAVRGVPLETGAKALVLKVDDSYLMVVLPADRALDSKTVKKLRRAKSIRFADREELARLTGLEPGAVPPFGRLFGLETLCDEGLAANESINFNAGSHRHSIRMRTADYISFERPVMGVFGKTH